MALRARMVAGLSLSLLAVAGLVRGGQLTPVWTRQILPPLGPTGAKPELIAELADGSVLVVNRDLWTVDLLRYDRAGVELSFARIFDFSEWNVVIDPAGAVVVTGMSQVLSGCFAAMKYDAATGRPMWAMEALLPGQRGESDHILPHAVDASGNVLVAGVRCRERKNVYGDRCVALDWNVTKLDGRTGRELWAVPSLRGPGSSEEIPVAVSADRNGDVLLLGIAANGLGNGEWVLYKLSGVSGTILWGPSCFGLIPTRSSAPRLMLSGQNGDVFVAGQISDGTTCFLGVLRVAGRTGQAVWGPLAIPYGLLQPKPDEMALAPDGDLVVLAPSILVKVRWRDGQIAWISEPGADYPRGHYGYRGSVRSIALDRSGDIWAIGSSPVGADYGKERWVAAKYSGTTGRLLVPPRVHSMPNELETTPGPAIVTQGGELVATARHQAPYTTLGTSFRVVTMALDNTSGETIWGPALREVGSATSERRPLRARLPGGDVVLGDSLGGNIFRIDVRRGNSVWGPVTYSDLGLAKWEAVFLGISGDDTIIVTGVNTAGPQESAELLALDAATGARRWGPVRVPEPFQHRWPLRGSLVTATGGVVVVVKEGTADEAKDESTAEEEDESIHQVQHQRFFAFSFDIATGAKRWGPSPLFDLEGPDPGAWLFVTGDREGNLIASIRAEGPGGDHVAKLLGASGKRAWQRRIDSMPIYSLAATVDGDVVLVGVWANPWWGRGWSLMKLSGVDGSVLWGPNLESGEERSDLYPFLVGIDPVGDVVVGGSMEIHLTYGSSFSFALGKYNGRTGDRVWGPIQDDMIECLHRGTHYVPTGYSALEFDDAGDILAMAAASGPGPNHWVATRHSGRTGSLEWTKVYPFPVGYEGSAFLSCVDGDLMVQLRQASCKVLERLTNGLALDLRGDGLTPARADVPYRYEFPVRNGEPPFRFRLVDGKLPPGTELGEASGILAGLPAREGTWTFTVEISDRRGSSIHRSLSVDVFPETTESSTGLTRQIRAVPTGLDSPLGCSEPPGVRP